MWLRVERAQENAQQVVNFLVRHPSVTQVFYPGQGGCDAKSLRIHKAQSSGSGAVMSFTTGSVEFSRRFVDACRLFKTTVSFGSVNSLGEMPCTMSHASIPSEKRTLPEDLVRLSVGIEDPRDLIEDLKRAFELAVQDKKPPLDDGYDSKFDDLPLVPSLPIPSQREDSDSDQGIILPSKRTLSPKTSSAVPPLPVIGSVEEDFQGRARPLPDLTPLAASVLSVTFLSLGVFVARQHFTKS